MIFARRAIGWHGTASRAASRRRRRTSVAVLLSLLGAMLASAGPSAEAAVGDLTRTGHAPEIPGFAPTKVAVSGSRVFAASVETTTARPQTTRLDVYNEASDGKLEHAASTNLGVVAGGVQDVLVTSRFVFVATFAGLRWYTHSPTSLDYLACVNTAGTNGCAKEPAVFQPASLAISPDETTLYVANANYGVVALRPSLAGGTRQFQFVDCWLSGVGNPNPDRPCGVGPVGTNLYGGTLALSRDGQTLFVGGISLIIALQTPTASRRMAFRNCYSGSDEYGTKYADAGRNCPQQPGGHAFGDAIEHIAVGATDASGRFEAVYAASDSTLFTYFYDRTTGLLHYTECHREVVVPAAGCPRAASFIEGQLAVAASPDGKSVYVASQPAFSVASFGLDPGRPFGTLAQGVCYTDVASDAPGCLKSVGLVQPVDIAVSQSGDRVYVAADVLSIFLRDTGAGPCRVACQGVPPGDTRSE